MTIYNFKKYHAITEVPIECEFLSATRVKVSSYLLNLYISLVQLPDSRLFRNDTFPDEESEIQ